MGSLESEPGMQTSAVEEAAVSDTTNEQQPETPETTTQPQSRLTRPQPETTAIVPREPEVIEGEVIEIAPTITSTPLKQKPYWLLIPCTIIFCLIFLAGSYLVPLLTPTATVTIIPVEKTITTTEAIKLHGRVLPALTLLQSTTVPATGKRHQEASRAQGSITFFNGLYIPQTVASGTILTGKDGVQVITDRPAVIPAANPPGLGQTTISAHAVGVGAQGNIPAGDINQECCLTAVKAVNTEVFTGGHNARDYIVVTKADFASAKAAIKTTLDKSERAALNAQMSVGEALTPPLCSEKITSDHRIGDEAKEVTVTVSETCNGILYNAHDVYQDAKQIETSEAKYRLGTGYSLVGDMQVSIIYATIIDQARGIDTITVKLDATYIYQITPSIQHHLSTLIAGKTKQQALAILLKYPGIQGAQITTRGGNQTLPEDPRSITIVVVNLSASL